MQCQSAADVSRLIQHGLPNCKTGLLINMQAMTKLMAMPSLQGKVAKWWVPEDCVFVDEIPHTAAGKIYKLQLRKQFKDYKFPTSKL